MQPRLESNFGAYFPLPRYIGSCGREHLNSDRILTGTTLHSVTIRRSLRAISSLRHFAMWWICADVARLPPFNGLIMSTRNDRWAASITTIISALYFFKLSTHHLPHARIPLFWNFIIRNECSQLLYTLTRKKKRSIACRCWLNWWNPVVMRLFLTRTLSLTFDQFIQ